MLVSQARFEANGKEVELIKLEEDEIELGKVVPYVGGSDTIKKTPVYKFTATYAKPQGKKPFDWSTLSTFTVDEVGGERYTYQDCRILKIGKSDIDDDNPKQYPIDFWAKRRVPG